jgi:hypothetical protein
MTCAEHRLFVPAVTHTSTHAATHPVATLHSPPQHSYLTIFNPAPFPLQVETWRPRVQGAQLKALAGARLPESEPEFAAISRVVSSLQDCLKPESSAELFMQELRITISQIQAWWENRNRRPDGEELLLLLLLLLLQQLL